MTNEKLTEIYNAAKGIDPKRHNPISTERIFAAMRAAISAEREACANSLNLSRSEALLMAGEITAQEWRTVTAVLKSLQARMRSNVELSGRANDL
jgi:uncharacterized membrane-anchored protein